jgi:hypothetical protein
VSTYSSLHYHITFSTKNRERWIASSWEMIPLGSVSFGIRFPEVALRLPPANSWHRSAMARSTATSSENRAVVRAAGQWGRVSTHHFIWPWWASTIRPRIRLFWCRRHQSTPVG